MSEIQGISGERETYIGQRGEAMETKKQILSLFSGRIREAMERAAPDFGKILEIRMRVDQPIIFRTSTTELFLKGNGSLDGNYEEAICPRLQEIKGVLENACGYSGYAFEEEIRNGYLTIAGGHRIGVVGQAVVEQGEVKTLKYVSALNIRVSHVLTGWAEPWRDHFYENRSPCHLLIISPPGCGKTTLLREVIRIYSEGNHRYSPVTVGVADERSEICGAYRGNPIHPLGMRTDVLDGCPKTIGMEILLRSMAPDVLAVDEIGREDVTAIEHALRCGCKIVATMHGDDLRDFLEKPGLQILAEEKIFQRYLFLKNDMQPGKIRCIYDRDLRMIFGEEQCT